MSQKNELENLRVCVILPISDLEPMKHKKVNEISYDSAIDSVCFSKPFIYFTVKELEKITFVQSIILCSTACRQEQIQEIVSEHISENEKIKYFFTPNISTNNASMNTSSTQHEVTKNRLLKYCLASLKRSEPFDIVVVHDPRNPYVCEQLLRSVCLEAMRNGGACVSSNEKPPDLLFKLEECNISEERQSLRRMSSARDSDLSSAIAYQHLDLNYRVAFKPQAFQFSIFRIIFENCSDEDLEKDVDCLILAMRYANIRNKLVFEKCIQSTGYSSRVCCIERYLKENHKQAFFLSQKFSEDAFLLQNALRLKNWNIESSNCLNKEAFYKLNSMLTAKKSIDGVVLIDFCEDLSDLEKFKLTFGNHQSKNKKEILMDVGGYKHGSDTAELTEEEEREEESERITSSLINAVLFMIKAEHVNRSITTSPQEAIRSMLKKNSRLNDVWYITIIYDSMNYKVKDLVDYFLRDRHESIRKHVFDCTQ